MSNTNLLVIISSLPLHHKFRTGACACELDCRRLTGCPRIGLPYQHKALQHAHAGEDGWHIEWPQELAAIVRHVKWREGSGVHQRLWHPLKLALLQQQRLQEIRVSPPSSYYDIRE